MRFMFLLILVTFFSSLSAEEYLHYNLGKKYAESGDLNLAVDEFRKVISVYPDHYNAYYQLALVQMKQGNYPVAEYNLKNALKYNPGWQKPYEALGQIYEKNGDLDNAIQVLQKARRAASEAGKKKITSKIDELVGRKRASDRFSDSIVTAQKQEEDRKKAALRPKPKKKGPTPQSAKDELNKAIRLYRDGVRSGDDAKLKKALTHIRKALAISPDYPAAFYYAGVIRRRFGQQEMARINFEKAVDDPEMGYNAHFYLGKIYGETEKYEKGIEHLNRYLDATDYEPGRREALAMIERYQRELEALKERMKIDVKEVTRTSISSELNQLPPEKRFSEIEVRLDNLLSMVIVDTLTNEGQAMLAGLRHFNNKEFDKAVEAFYKVLEKYSRGEVAGYSLYNIGICRMKLRDWDGAAKIFRQYIDRFPEGKQVSSAQFLEAIATFEMKDLSKAESLLGRYIRSYRDGAHVGKAYEKLGDLFLLLDDQSRAVDAFQQASDLSVTALDKVFANYKLGETYSLLKNFAMAKKSFQEVISTGEQNGIFERVPDSYYQMADKDFSSGEYEEAFRTYEKVTRQYPSYKDTPWGIFQMGNIKKKLKMYEDAIAFYDMVIEKYPEDYWKEQAQWKKKDAVWEFQYGDAGGK